MIRTVMSRTKKTLVVLAIAGAATALGTVAASADDHTMSDRGAVQVAATPFDDHTMGGSDDHTMGTHA